MPEGTNPAQERQMLLAIANRPIDTNTTYLDRRRRVALPAPHRPGTSTRRQTADAVGSCQRPCGRSRPLASPAGPVVRVARGNNVTVVPVGAR